jgi:hydroxymethylglutaryl-CoA reductase
MPIKPSKQQSTREERRTSRIPRFYRLSVEQRLAFLQRNFDLSNEEVAMLRAGNALRIDHAVNMVENEVGVLGLPVGLGLNFLIDGDDYLVPMAIEEASIIAAASKAALIIRGAGGFATDVDDPVMIGQVQVTGCPDPEAAQAAIEAAKQRIIEAANLPNERMVARGGGCFDLETRVISGGPDVGEMLVVQLLINVQEAMGANAVNYSCESAGPVIEELTGGTVNLRIVSNYATRRLARASFRLPIDRLPSGELTDTEAAQRMVQASALAENDPWRAATHNKGIFNGICAAGLALGQDWRAIEAGGHAYAARDGQYRGLTRYWVEDGCLCGSIELPLQVGWVGGAVNSHPGVRIMRKISGIHNAGELARVLAAVGLAQNFAACLALSTVGIQKGHMALHARSVAISAGVPSADVERVAQEMIRMGQVKVAVAEEVYGRLQRNRGREGQQAGLPVESYAPGKIVLFGEHATVYGYPGITAAIGIGLKAYITEDPDGPRFTMPRFKRVFDIPESELDVQLFSRAINEALDSYGLRKAPIAIHIESELVPGMGLGSSAAFSAALCTVLRKYKQQDQERRWDNDLFEEVQRLEAIFHGSPSGMDAATVLTGGLLWFRPGPPRELLPLRAVTPVTGIVCFVEPGARTIELVRQVAHSRELNPERIDGILAKIGDITAQAGAALGAGDMELAGELMLGNHEQLAHLGVSTDALDQAVQWLVDAGALGAKLTGAGGGGAAVALTQPEDQYTLLEQAKGRFPFVFPFSLGHNE